MTAKIICGDSREILRQIPSNHFHGCVTDPPYELLSISKRFGGANAAPAKFGRDGRYSRQSRGFMGKQWDATGVPKSPEFWAEVLRVLRPGAYVLAFGGTRSYHRQTCAMEDAGFIIQDCFNWLYGTGMPKSQDISADMDRLEGETPEIVEECGRRVKRYKTANARKWEGWGTAVTPCHEPIVLAQKPLRERSIALNVLQWGTGALNVSACEVGPKQWRDRNAGPLGEYFRGAVDPSGQRFGGRYPGNLLLGHSPDCSADTCVHYCPMFHLRATHGETRSSGGGMKGFSAGVGPFGSSAIGNISDRSGLGDVGGVDRYFPQFRFTEPDFPAMYCPKPSQRERHRAGQNTHATVKPLELIKWLCRLIIPPGGIVLDPFGGSGTTALAAEMCGFDSVTIELERESAEIAAARVAEYRRRVGKC